MKKTKPWLTVIAVLVLAAFVAGFWIHSKSKEDCVVFTDLSVTAGQKAWNHFLKETEKGKPATVRLEYYYTEEQITYSADLQYDGEIYRYYDYDNGETIKSEDYRYLKRIEGRDEDPFSELDKYVYYVLVNEEDAIASNEDVMKRYASSLSTDLTSFKVVYIDLTHRGNK